MDKFNYGYGPPDFRKHTNLQRVANAIEISCESPAVECKHRLEVSAFENFNEFLGQFAQADPIFSVSVAVAEGKFDEVYEAIHCFAVTTFSWINFED